jgi:hypothetical protein
VPNLNPSQVAKLRPQSASLRTPRGDPSFSRLRNDGQATPRLKPPEVAPAAGEEEPWLFSFHRSLTTMDAWRMGFSRVMVFGAHNWADEATAASELCEAFRATKPMPDLSARYKPDLEAMIAPCFLRGDVLLAIQCTQCSSLPEADAKKCIAHVAKMLDCVSNVWMQYDEMSEVRTRTRAHAHTHTRTHAHAHAHPSRRPEAKDRPLCIQHPRLYIERIVSAPAPPLRVVSHVAPALLPRLFSSLARARRRRRRARGLFRIEHRGFMGERRRRDELPCLAARRGPLRFLQVRGRVRLMHTLYMPEGTATGFDRCPLRVAQWQR